MGYSGKGESLMYITADILLDVLENNYKVVRCGRAAQDVELEFPVFYEKDMPLKRGGLYIAKSMDLPPICEVVCVFVCVGKCPSRQPYRWAGTIFSIDEPLLNILSLFNFVQLYFSKISTWAHRMHELLEKEADLKEYVLSSLDLFGNGITITDYNLQILVNCSAVTKDGRRELMIDTQFDRVPSEISAEFKHIFLQSISSRKPFIYKGQREDPEGDNYCINLYIGDAYIGCCTLYDCMKPMRQSDCALFQIFAEYIRQAMTRLSVLAASNVVTMKTIFSSILQAFPVSKEDLKLATQSLQRNMQLSHEVFQGWHCIVLSSANRRKVLPEQYICTTVEDMLPHTVAIAQDGHIVMLCAVSDRSTMEETFCPILQPYLKDMNFRVAVSAPFHDVFKAINYYEQAVNTLEIGSKTDPEEHIYSFETYVLTYLLSHAIGEYAPELLITKGLQELRTASDSVDYWDTLKQFLDNECNASETARKMFLHRSTLLTRLEKIRQWVDIDSPDTRMYLRIMTRLLSN